MAPQCGTDTSTTCPRLVHKCPHCTPVWGKHVRIAPKPGAQTSTVRPTASVGRAGSHRTAPLLCTRQQHALARGKNVCIASRRWSNTSALHPSAGQTRQQHAALGGKRPHCNPTGGQTRPHPTATLGSASTPAWGRNGCIARQRWADASATQPCVGHTAPHCPLAGGKNVHSTPSASLGHARAHPTPMCCVHVNNRP